MSILPQNKLKIFVLFGISALREKIPPSPLFQGLFTSIRSLGLDVRSADSKIRLFQILAQEFESMVKVLKVRGMKAVDLIGTGL